MPFRKAVLALAAGSYVLLAAGCGGSSGDGGGGGGGSDAIHVSYSWSPLVWWIPVWGVGGYSLVVSATVAPVPTTPTYVFLLDSGNVVVPGSVTVTANGNGSYSAHLPLKNTLVAGSHAGTFTLQLCRDAACASPYTLTGASVPYTLNVTPQVTTTATAVIKVGGATQAITATVDGNGVKHYAVSVPTGSLLEMQTSIDIVSWTYSGAGTLPAQTGGSVTPTTYDTTLSLSVPTDTSEALTVRGLAADGQEFSFDLTVMH
jgi:hypothetical protein